MSEYIRAQKEAERERARCLATGSPGQQPVETAGKPPRCSVAEPDSQLQPLLLEPVNRTVRAGTSTRDSWQRRRRKHVRRGLRVTVGTVLVFGVAPLLGSYLANWVGRAGQNAVTADTGTSAILAAVPADTDASTISVATTTPPSAITTGESAVLFRVQVGAFVNPDNAERLAERLRTDGFSVAGRSLWQQTKQRPAHHTVQIVLVGAYRTAGLAEHARAELARLGYVGFVVREP